MSKSLKLFSTFLCAIFFIMLLIGRILSAGAEQNSQQRATIDPYLIIIPHKIDVDANDFVYDETRDTIFVSIKESAQVYSNSILPISVPTGTIGTPIVVGSDPNRVELADDKSYLYVGLDGSGSVRRVNLDLATPDIEFYLGSDYCGPYKAQDMVVLKNHPESVAVSIRNSWCSPRHEGVAIYDNGIKRPMMTQELVGSNEIEPSDVITKLYGYNNETSSFAFRYLSIDEHGIYEDKVVKDILKSYFLIKIKYYEGYIYATNGEVLDPSDASTVGKYDVEGGAVSPDLATNQVFIAYGDGYYQHPHTVEIFEMDSFNSIQKIPIKLSDYYSSTPLKLEYLGGDYLVLLTKNNTLYILQMVEMDNFVYFPISLSDW